MHHAKNEKIPPVACNSNPMTASTSVITSKANTPPMIKITIPQPPRLKMDSIIKPKMQTESATDPVCSTN